MDRLETADILAVLKAAYPQFYNGLSPKEANKIVDLWAEMFKDEPVMVVAVAVKAMIASRTNTFPPNIGEVKEQITKMRMPKEMTAAEAWTIGRLQTAATTRKKNTTVCHLRFSGLSVHRSSFGNGA